MMRQIASDNLDILCPAGIGLGKDRDRLLFNAVTDPVIAFVERQAAFLKIQQERWSFDAPCRCHLPGRSARRYAALLTADGGPDHSGHHVDVGYVQQLATALDAQGSRTLG